MILHILHVQLKVSHHCDCIYNC